MLFTLLLIMNLSFAADNSIYIDQVGDSADIDITQDGSANKVYGVGDSEGTAATLTGNSQSVDIRQVGSSNLLGIDLNTTVTSGVGIDLTYYITGSNSVASIDVNGDGQGTASNNTIDIRMTGDYNDFNFTINADSTTSNVAISGGGGNTTTLSLSSDSATVDITAAGASNTIGVTQTGLGGTNGMNFDLDITGSSNTWASTQSGSQDNDIDVNITGDSNNWSITQSD